MFKLASITTIALAAIANAMPQGIGTGSNACPPGCKTKDVFESKTPDPHQTYFYQQMTNNHQCGKNGGCEISKSEVEGQSVSLSASISGDGWISAGFEVSEYQESGEAQTCYGEPGDTICVWWRTANTMYTVDVQYYKCCQKSGGLTPQVITSPNSNNQGSSAICGRNEQCHTKGHSYWNNMERSNGGVTVSGGPQEWKFGGDLTGLVPDSDEIPEAKAP
ncbi:unnamed protein product [Fusarium graminearum]|uniref:Secreted protein n=2 Tax=Fusarium sambucinum species complex TaxID=569360 RepID=A0A2H3GGG5_GIBZA|nr:hypothetical protein FAUST_5674 [Fusarium austroamericanum]KAI6755852.1 hypothetical protein HG531_004958 [Fusarium graminearum]PCD29747.1 hypothetical protein FGRA07_10751 [Fusarium graminearum]CAF3453605.1 unnamed protein product [Fusarium graminearum]CAF3494105.1 unnamed protein product [Fusarium graminearum]